jgi:RimJ/RimL family protein N-acetyltransferase
MFGTAETDRLRLERWDHDAHAAGLAAVNADPGVSRYVGDGTAVPRAESDEQSARIAWHWERYGFGLWAAVVKETGAMIGFIGVCHPLWFPDMSERIEVGWRLGRDAWGHGYATEGALALLAHGFDAVGLAHVWAQTMAVNRASRAVMERIGLVFERTWVGAWNEPLPGWKEGEVAYGLTREAWRARP